MEKPAEGLLRVRAYVYLMPHLLPVNVVRVNLLIKGDCLLLALTDCVTGSPNRKINLAWTEQTAHHMGSCLCEHPGGQPGHAAVTRDHLVMASQHGVSF